MFVQEEKIFAGKVLKIHICTMDGTEWLEEVTEDTTIEKVKEKCLKHVGLKKKKLFVLHSVIPLTTVPPESKLPVSVSLRFVFIASGEARLFII